LGEERSGEEKERRGDVATLRDLTGEEGARGEAREAGARGEAREAGARGEVREAGERGEAGARGEVRERGRVRLFFRRFMGRVQ